MTESTPENLGRVVVGVDGRESGDRAVDVAADEAAAHAKPLLLCHCPPTNTTSSHPVLEAALRRAQKRRPEIAATTTVLDGVIPASALAAHVAADDLLVVGTRSKHRLRARILGSTSSQLLRRCPCDVMAVPPFGERRGRGSFEHHVVAAVDGRASTDAVIGAGYTEALAHDLPLLVVHAQQRDNEITGSSFDERFQEVTLTPYPECHAMLQDAVAPWRRRHRDIVVRQACFHGPVSDVLVHVAVGARVVLLGQGHRPWHPVQHLDALLRSGHCPAIVVAAQPATT